MFTIPGPAYETSPALTSGWLVVIWRVSRNVVGELSVPMTRYQRSILISCLIVLPGRPSSVNAWVALLTCQWGGRVWPHQGQAECLLLSPAREWGDQISLSPFGHSHSLGGHRFPLRSTCSFFQGETGNCPVVVYSHFSRILYQSFTCSWEKYVPALMHCM